MKRLKNVLVILAIILISGCTTPNHIILPTKTVVNDSHYLSNVDIRTFNVRFLTKKDDPTSIDELKNIMKTYMQMNKSIGLLSQQYPDLYFDIQIDIKQCLKCAIPQVQIRGMDCIFVCGCVFNYLAGLVHVLSTVWCGVHLFNMFRVKDTGY